MKTIITEWFDMEFTNNPELPKKVASQLQDFPNKFDDSNLLATRSIYSWMKQLQVTLLGPSRRTGQPNQVVNKRHSGMSESKAKATGRHRPSGLYRSGPSVDKILHNKAAKISRLSDKETKFVEEKLAKGHKFIEYRQDKVATELVAWRDKQVARRENVLKERELG